jgi:hypothetical protein
MYRQESGASQPTVDSSWTKNSKPGTAFAGELDAFLQRYSLQDLLRLTRARLEPFLLEPYLIESASPHAVSCEEAEIIHQFFWVV